MKETWLDIIEFEGIYQISNFGSVKRDNKLLKACKAGQGNYLKVSLHNKEKVKQIYIHRLVAIHFLENPKNKYSVNHKDGDRYNNRVDNLEWATGSEQNNHAYSNKLKLPGENCNFSKLKEYQVLEIFYSNKSQKDIALEYNISQPTVSFIKRKITWKHLLKNT